MYGIALVLVLVVAAWIGNYVRDILSSFGELAYWQCKVCGGSTVVGNRTCAHCGEEKGAASILITVPHQRVYAEVH